FCLAEVCHHAYQDIGVVKFVRNSDCAILRKPVEARRRWKYCDRLLDETFQSTRSLWSRTCAMFKRQQYALHTANPEQ
ncbi:hypothetical protein V3C99_012544, partial [Haemonchus contortus]